MAKIGIWRVTNQGPVKLIESNINLEKQLEDWIEKDPSLLQSGLTIVGRQISYEDGRWDLLALDTQGKWIMIELKAGMLRRDVFTQVLDYASCVATMPFDILREKVDGYLKHNQLNLKTLLEERGLDEQSQQDSRDVKMIIVGTGREPGLERMVAYLTERYEMPITMVTFEVFQLADGQQILLRELTESDFLPPEEGSKKQTVINALLTMANRYPTGASFHKLLEAAQGWGMYARPYKTSIMITPPNNRNRMLFTIWAEPKTGNVLRAYIDPAVFAEFYPISEEAARNFLGNSGWRTMSPAAVDEFIAGLGKLFEMISKQSS
jgi:hypothetical protein